jgi:TetR/AcrR family fatty acid metabolism transcriptional regulator
MKSRSATKRRAIVEAAFAVVAEKGYYETKVEDVAREAGVAKGTVYLYFKDKPDLYIGIVDWLLEQALAILREVAARTLPARQKLEAVFDAWAGGVLSRPAVISLLSPENVEQSSHVVRRFRRDVLPHIMEMMNEVGAIIESGIRTREFRRVDPRLAALAFLNAFRSAMFGVASRLPVPDPSRTVKEMFFCGILAGDRRVCRRPKSRS